MDHYLNEQQIEELANFDYVSEDLSDLIEEEKRQKRTKKIQRERLSEL